MAGAVQGGTARACAAAHQQAAQHQRHDLQAAALLLRGLGDVVLRIAVVIAVMVAAVLVEAAVLGGVVVFVHIGHSLLLSVCLRYGKNMSIV